MRRREDTCDHGVSRRLVWKTAEDETSRSGNTKAMKSKNEEFTPACWHVALTRPAIHVDPSDHLLRLVRVGVLAMVDRQILGCSSFLAADSVV